ncbi:MAG TPA: hypothetical protein VFV99_33815 [Kofleriaceae bacterium]|nr:hypothetical protein [Kofleriaceae bacterium]
MRVAVALALLTGVTACRSSGDGGGSRTITVNAFAGDQPEGGATVIGHAPDGSVIDQTTADAVGQATISVDADSLVSVIFPGNIGALTPVISVVTVAAEADTLSIYGPRYGGPPPLIVGALQVDAPNLNAADYFDIHIGCATTRVQQLPATIDVGACSMGSDTKLDVLLTGSHDVGSDPPAPQLDGYAAARVDMVNGLATFTAPAWQTTGPSVPVTLDGVMPLVMVEPLSDGLSFGAQQATDHATLWTGLVVDATRITASLAGINAARVTTREVAGAPTAINFGTSDFLPPIDVTAALTLSTTTLTWDPNSIGDTVNMHATWDVDSSVAAAVPTGPHRVIWDAVLPPDATDVTLPVLAGDLGVAINPKDIAPVDIVVRYIDADGADGFAGLLAAGVHAEDTLQASTIAPRPTDGEIRVSHAIGLR